MMTATTETGSESEHMLRAGAAARLAGIPVETLRVWERRYAISGAEPSHGRQRLYAKADVVRLSLIKRLVDLGQQVSSLARLDTEALQETLSTFLSLRQDGFFPTDRLVRVALIGPVLTSGQIAKNLSVGAFDLCLSESMVEAAFKRDSKVTADLLLIEMPTLNEASAAQVLELKARLAAGKIVVFYRFAPSVIIKMLTHAGVDATRAPVDEQEIERLCLAMLRPVISHAESGNHFNTAARVAPAAPRFSAQALAVLSQMQSNIYCECPSQLAGLVQSVASFETYSAECASRNSIDALLHQELQQVAGQARMLLERALDKLVIAEGISIPRNMP